MLKIRRPLGRLIFNMGIAIPGKTVFLIETAPCILRIPRCPMITHTTDSYWIPSQIKTMLKLQIWKISKNFTMPKFYNGLCTRHTFWSCLIRCIDMKWIQRGFLKIQSGHDSVHRRMDGQMNGLGETSITPLDFVEVSQWVIKFNCLFGDNRHQGP